MTAANPAEALCLECGLCCNGVLFGDVRFQKDDPPDCRQTLERVLGRTLNTRFKQPCACLEGKRCVVYADRPARCRSFQCRVLQGVVSRAIAPDAGSRKVKAACDAVERVQVLLREAGDTNENQPLNRRYAQLMKQPWDLSAADQNRSRRKLMKAFDALQKVLRDDFI